MKHEPPPYEIFEWSLLIADVLPREIIGTDSCEIFLFTTEKLIGTTFVYSMLRSLKMLPLWMIETQIWNFKLG